MTTLEETRKQCELGVNLVAKLRQHLDTLTITSSTIESIRAALFLPFSCSWNVTVREETESRIVRRQLEADRAILADEISSLIQEYRDRYEDLMGKPLNNLRLRFSEDCASVRIEEGDAE